MINNTEFESIYQKGDFNLFISKIMEYVCFKLKELNIDKRFANKLIQDVKKIKLYIEDLVSNYDSYDELINQINSYINQKLLEIYDIYLKDNDNMVIDLSLSDENIKNIKIILEKLTKKEVLKKGDFNYYEKRIINIIHEGKDPYEMVSNEFPARGIINFIENIVNILNELYETQKLNNKLQDYNQNELFYLDKIDLVKKWTYKFPIEMYDIIYNKGIKFLSELIRKKGYGLTEQEIIFELNNMPISVLKNNKRVNMLVSENIVNNFEPQNEFEKVIFDYYYKNIDQEYNPDNIKLYEISYGDSEIKKEKYNIVFKLLDSKKYRNSK